MYWKVECIDYLLLQPYNQMKMLFVQFYIDYAINIRHSVTLLFISLKHSVSPVSKTTWLHFVCLALNALQ
ncbi:hypothetical protein ACTXT7_016278, partial [Hymenolepis weldensis]